MSDKNEARVARVVDEAFRLFLTGMERDAVLEEVRQREAAGKTPDQIADDLAQMRRDSSAAARAA
jgi:hypothetical protein